MARPKKQVKLKEPIKIRLKSLADGNKSIYLDIYYKGVRKYEYLKLYLVPEINPICKEQNKQTMAVAERIKAERIKALRPCIMHYSPGFRNPRASFLSILLHCLTTIYKRPHLNQVLPCKVN